MSMLLAALAAMAMQDGRKGEAARPQPAQVRAIVDCRSLPDQAARLACYDGAVDALAAATAKGNILVVDREDVRRTRRSLFGFALPKLPFFSGDKSQDEVPDEIEATVKSARAFGYQRWQVTLEEGGVWQTTEPQTLQPLPRPGTKVTLRKGMLGAYRIIVGKGRPITAMRVG